MKTISNFFYLIDIICRIVTFFALISYLQTIVEKILHKKVSEPWTNDAIVSIIVVFSLAYIPWFNYSVTLETIPSGVYEIKVGIRETSTDDAMILSTAEIEIERDTEYEDYEDYMGVSRTKTKVYENVYLTGFVYSGEQFWLDDEELQIGCPMEIDCEKENKRFEIEVCSNELDLNTVGLTKADVRASRDILSTILYYAEVIYAACYTFMLIKRKREEQKRG